MNAHGTVGTAQCQDQRAPGAAVHLPSLSPHRAGDSNMSQTEYEVGGYKAALDMNKKKIINKDDQKWSCLGASFLFKFYLKT